MNKEYTPEEAKAWLAGYDEGKRIHRQPTKLITVGDVLEQAGYVKKKEWVGLTDDEVDDIGCDFATLGGDIESKNWFAFYLAIEAKLKEKNI